MKKKEKEGDKKIKAEGIVRARESRGEEGERKERQREDIQINTCVCQVVFFCTHTLPFYYSFSVSLLLNTHTCALAVNPAATAILCCFLLLKALSPSAALAILQSLTKPLHEAFS